MTEVHHRRSVISKRGFAASLCTLLFTFCVSVEAQQPRKIPHIGYLRTGSPLSGKVENDAFREGLNDLGYTEGKNIVIEYRYAQGQVNRIPNLVAELVRLKVDVIVVGGNRATKAVKQATTTIPVVVGSAEDLVGGGLVASLARPGGNITGSTGIAPDLSGKRLQLLKETVPNASRVALLWFPATKDAEIRQTENSAPQLGIKIVRAQVRDPSEFQSAYVQISKESVQAVVIIQSGFTLAYRPDLVELAVKRRLPSMCEQSEWTKDGCLMSYGRDQVAEWRRAAYFVDRILKGAKPTDLPVEQPTKFELVINLKTAKKIGLIIPPNVLARADRVIR